MQEFLTTLVSFPTIAFTCALAMALLYWMVVIFGALDLDFLDSVLGLDSMDAAFDGALESIEGVADGGVEGAAESIDGALEDVSRGSWKKNGALHSVIRVSDQAATSACLRTSLRPW